MFVPKHQSNWNNTPLESSVNVLTVLKFMIFISVILSTLWNFSWPKLHFMSLVSLSSCEVHGYVAMTVAPVISKIKTFQIDSIFRTFHSQRDFLYSTNQTANLELKSDNFSFAAIARPSSSTLILWLQGFPLLVPCTFLAFFVSFRLDFYWLAPVELWQLGH